MARILLFGLSANPPTGEGGHLGLVRWAAERPAHPEIGGRIEAIWVLPVHRHAFAEKSELAPWPDRVEMCRLTFEGLPLPVPVVVSTAEAELAAERGPNVGLGTIDLIDHLEARYGRDRFALLLGADTASDLYDGRWKGAEELRRRVPLVVAPRAGTTTPEAGVVAADAPVLADVSSTEARQAARDPVRLRTMVTEAVARYIEDHGLYGARESEPSR